VPPVTARNSCTRCGDLTVRGSGSVGFGGPWPFQRHGPFSRRCGDHRGCAGVQLIVDRPLCR
jgi:hypothetical protein